MYIVTHSVYVMMHRITVKAQIYTSVPNALGSGKLYS